GKAKELYSEVYPKGKIKLIANGIDLEEYSLAPNSDHLKEELGLRVEDKVVGVVGRLVPGKGFTDFLAAAKILNDKGLALRYIIVGAAAKEDRQYEDNLRQIAIDQGLGQKVIFTGWREDVKELISIFDVLIQPSSTFPEGFGMTVLEAMALGKPVIVTDVPGPGELVVNGKTGLIVLPADPAKLAGAIETIINDQTLSETMGKAARHLAATDFNIENTVKKLEHLYAELLGKEGQHVY
ncbi:MAG: glycosyltransferase family 4 protein, partial [bacterium]|nr:glycosyltransferase family 4 protein [bacterium]